MAQNRPDLSRSLDRLLSRSRPPPPPPPPPRPRSLDLDRRSRDLDLDLCLQRKFEHFIVSPRSVTHLQCYAAEHLRMKVMAEKKDNRGLQVLVNWHSDCETLSFCTEQM